MMRQSDIEVETVRIPRPGDPRPEQIPSANISELGLISQFIYSQLTAGCRDLLGFDFTRDIMDAKHDQLPDLAHLPIGVFRTALAIHELTTSYLKQLRAHPSRAIGYISQDGGFRKLAEHEQSYSQCNADVFITEMHRRMATRPEIAREILLCVVRLLTGREIDLPGLRVTALHRHSGEIQIELRQTQ